MDGRDSPNRLRRRLRLIAATGAPGIVAAAASLAGVVTLLVTRHDLNELSKNGRPVEGKVLTSAVRVKGLSRTRFAEHSFVGVQDVDLGWQSVEVFGSRPIGQRVSVVCSTALRRCEGAEDVAEAQKHWPWTTPFVAAVFLTAAGLTWQFAGGSRRQRETL